MKPLQPLGAVRTTAPRRAAVPDVETRFRSLVQSPLRACLLRFLHARPAEWFDLETLMAAAGCLRLDALKCLDELVTFGVARQAGGPTPEYASTWPTRSAAAALLRAFLDEDASDPDGSDAARRFRDTVARDERMLVVLEWIRTAAKSDIAVLVVGPQGSHTELTARMIHDLGRHARAAFHAVRCADLRDAAGVVRAFGPDGPVRPGARGTLFLDGIDQLSPGAQDALVGALEAREELRLIASSRRALDVDVREDRFRADLHQALNGFAIRLPALRERPADVPVLAERLLAHDCEARGMPADARVWSAVALARLQEHAWPGDMRELERTVAEAAETARGRVIDVDDLPPLEPAQRTAAAFDTGLGTLRDAERLHIVRVLDAVNWNKKAAARVLDISRGTLYRKIDEYGLVRGTRPRGGRT